MTNCVLIKTPNHQLFHHQTSKKYHPPSQNKKDHSYVWLLKTCVSVEPCGCYPGSPTTQSLKHATVYFQPDFSPQLLNVHTSIAQLRLFGEGGGSGGAGWSQVATVIWCVFKASSIWFRHLASWPLDMEFKIPCFKHRVFIKFHPKKRDRWWKHRGFLFSIRSTFSVVFLMTFV